MSTMSAATRSKAIVAALSTLLASCVAMHEKPRVMYEGRHPHSETAILIASDDRNPAYDWSQIREVDGKSAKPFGHPAYGVRVLPGTHTFTLRAIRNFKSDTAHGGPYDYLEFDVEVPDMKPLHVYAAPYDETGGKLRVTIEDLGERASYRTKRAPRPTF